MTHSYIEKPNWLFLYWLQAQDSNHPVLKFLVLNSRRILGRMFLRVARNLEWETCKRLLLHVPAVLLLSC